MPQTSLIIALSLTAALAGCLSREQRPALEQESTVHEVTLHSVTGTKLGDSIRRLNNLVLERHLTEPELDKQRQQANALILEVAKGAESSLDCLMKAAPRLNLDADQLKHFYSLADDLRDEVKTLNIHTQIHQFDDIPATLDKMKVTCTSCHELFRRPTLKPASRIL